MIKHSQIEFCTSNVLEMFNNKEENHFKFYNYNVAAITEENIKINYNRNKNLLTKIKYNKGKKIEDQYYYIELLDITELIEQLLNHYKVVGINKHYDKFTKSKNEIVFYIEKMYKNDLKLRYYDIVKYIDNIELNIIPAMIEELEEII